MNASFAKFELTQVQVKDKGLRYLASDLILRNHYSADIKGCDDSNGFSMVIQVDSPHCPCFHYFRFFT